MANVEKRVKYWILYINGDQAGYLNECTPGMEYGYMISFFDPELSKPQGHKERDIEHWSTCPVYD